jgi:hypothetical protein
MIEVTLMLLLVLQCCTDSLHILPGLSSVTHTMSYDIGYVKVEEDVDVKQEGFIAFNEEVDIGIKQEEISEDINFQDINAEPYEVSCVYMSFIRHIFTSVWKY